MTATLDWTGYSAGLGNRDVTVGGTAQYLPLALPVGRTYTESFNMLDGVGDLVGYEVAPVVARRVELTVGEVHVLAQSDCMVGVAVS